MSSRFDRIFYLELPDEQARRSTLINSLRLDKTIKLTDAGERMTNVVEATIGKSYSELVQYCRQAIDVMARSENDQASEVFSWSALAALNDRLQSVAPESVRSGVMDDCVDMRVFTAKDLLGTLGAQASNSTITTPKIGYTFPMKGKSAAAAWKEMQTSVVVPLCQSKKLYALIDAENGGTQQSVVGAILLTGESGSGKSEIAMHCARHSALLLPTVKLIDVSCTSLIHKEVGGSERAVHQLFHAARRAAPCILMLDGIETVAAVRGNDATTEGTMDRVLSTLLIELDGVEDYTGPNRGIAVIGITRDASWIDPALKRPGRLNRAICLQRDWS